MFKKIYLDMVSALDVWPRLTHIEIMFQLMNNP